MFEATGSLAIVQPELLLVGLVVLPLLWALTAALSRPRPEVGRAMSVACASGLFALSVALTIKLARAPHGHVLVQHVAQLARLGELDLPLELTLNARSAVFVLLVAVVGVASALQPAWSSPARCGVRLGWSGLATASAMLVCLGDGVAPLVVGLGGLSLAAWGLARDPAPAASVVAFAGNISVLAGYIFLFWSLGGFFGPEGYDSDGLPRFVLVTTNTPAADPSQATLVMTTNLGARVSSDDADLPGEPIPSPFSILVPPSFHTLRIQQGVASSDVVVSHVALAPGRTQALVPYGPTMSLRALEAQVAVPRLDASGRLFTVRTALAERTIGGLHASFVILVLVLGGVLAHVYAVGARRGRLALVTVLEALPAPLLAIRLGPLVDPLAVDGALVLLLGAGSAVLLAARAASAEDHHQVLRGVLGAASAAALTAAGLGEPSAAIVLMASAMLATCSALVALDARSDARWLGLACAALVGALPGAGTSTGLFLSLTAALSTVGQASGLSRVLCVVLGLALAAACALGSLAAFRVYHAVLLRRPTARASHRSTAPLTLERVLTIAGLVAGVVLGVGTAAFGGHEAPLASRLTGDIPRTTSANLALFSLVLALAMPAGGFLLARRESSSMSGSGWLVRLGSSHALVTRVQHAVRDVAWFFHRSVRAMDREVIDDVDGMLFDSARRGVAESRFFGVALVVMVALLALIVLSSLALG